MQQLGLLPGFHRHHTNLKMLITKKWTEYLTSCRLLEAATQRVLGGDRLIMGDLVAVLAGVTYVVSMVLDLLAALGVVVGVTGGGGGRGGA